MNKKLSTSWLLVLIMTPLITILIFTVEFFSSKYDWVNNYGVNFITELIGIAITVLVIDRIIERNNNKKHLELAKPFYKKIKSYLEGLAQNFEQAAKWSIEKEIKTYPSREELYSEQIMGNLKYLDFSNKYSKRLDLYDYFYIEVSTNTRDIQIYVASLKLFLDDEYLSYLFSVTEHPFISSFLTAHTNKNNDTYKKLVLKSEGDNIFFNRKNDITDFMKKYIKLVEYHEKLTKQKLMVGTAFLWSNDFEPKFGQFRNELTRNP